MSGVKYHPKTIIAGVPDNYSKRFTTPVPKVHHQMGRSYDDLLEENKHLRNENNRLRKKLGLETADR